MAVAIPISTSPSWLLSQWAGQGWSVARQQTLRAIPVGSSSGRYLTDHPPSLDAFEWKDITLFGIGNTDAVVSQLDQEIANRGSTLYGYTLFKKVDVDLLGIRVVSYRLLLVHTQVQLAAWAVVILASAFAAVIFLQYLTTGQSPAVADLQRLWAGIIRPVAEGAGSIINQGTQGIGTVYLLGIAAAGAIAIAFAQAGKATGTKIREPRGPSGSVGLRAGPVSGRVSS